MPYKIWLSPSKPNFSLAWNNANTYLLSSISEKPILSGLKIFPLVPSVKPLIEYVCKLFFFFFEKEMASHSSVLTWIIPGTGEPGGLPSLGSHRVGHDCSDLAEAAAWQIHVDVWQKATQYCKTVILSEKEMATHSSVLAWRIPGTEEPSGLPSMGSHRVGHDWSDLAAAAVILQLKISNFLKSKGDF